MTNKKTAALLNNPVTNIGGGIGGALFLVWTFWVKEIERIDDEREEDRQAWIARIQRAEAQITANTFDLAMANDDPEAAREAALRFLNAQSKITDKDE